MLKWLRELCSAAGHTSTRRVVASQPASINNPPADWHNLGYGNYTDRRLWHDGLRLLQLQLLVTQARRTGRCLFVEE